MKTPSLLTLFVLLGSVACTQTPDDGSPGVRCDGSHGPCDAGGGPVAADPDRADLGGPIEGTPDLGGSGGPAGCADPATGAVVPAGTTIDTYPFAAPPTAAECVATRVRSTCSGRTGSFLPPPASSLSCAAEVAPASGAVYYFSDCQAGAQAGCVAGDNANPGTSPVAPRRDLTGFAINTVPAGTHLLFARGGAWVGFFAHIENPGATTLSPVVFGSYAPSWGGTSRPWLKSNSGTGTFEFGFWNSAVNDGGYIVRNLKIDGEGVGVWGFWLRDYLHHLTVENTEITGYQIGIHVQSATHDAGVTFATFRKLDVHHNSAMGFLGHQIDSRIEDSRFAFNNFSGSGFNHAIYLGGGGRRMVVRRNVFDRNSVVDGTCQGGNVTVHGQWDDVLLESNVITQTVAGGGCYGFSLNPGYATAEYLRHFVVRGNTVVNLGYCSICASAAPGILIENNLVVNDQAQYASGVWIGGDDGPEDEADSGAIIRNNTIVLSGTTTGEGIGLRADAGSNLQVVSNLVVLGDQAGSGAHCFGPTASSSFTAFDSNVCRQGAGTWSQTLATLAEAQAAGYDPHGLSSDPQLVAAPSSENGWSCALAAGSPAIDAGHATLSSSIDRAYSARVTPDVGACERP